MNKTRLKYRSLNFASDVTCVVSGKGFGRNERQLRNEDFQGFSGVKSSLDLENHGNTCQVVKLKVMNIKDHCHSQVLQSKLTHG